MAIAAELRARIGLDPSRFNRAVDSAQRKGEEFAQNWEKLGKIFAAGALLTAVTGFFDMLIARANESEDALDDAAATVREFGEGFEAAKNGVLDFGVSLLSWINKAGEGLGVLVNLQTSIWRGGPEAVATNMQIAEQTERTLAAIAAQKEATDELVRLREQIGKAQEKQAQAAFNELSTAQQLDQLIAQAVDQEAAQAAAGLSKVERAQRQLALEETLVDLQSTTIKLEKETAEAKKKAQDEALKLAEKEADERKKTAELLAQYAFEDAERKRRSLSLDEQRNQLLKEKRDLEAFIANRANEEVKRREAIIRLRAVDNELADVKTALEAQITAELLAQNAALAEQEKIRRRIIETVGRDYEDQSTRSLEKVRDQLRSELADRRAAGGIGVGASRIDDPLIAFQESQLGMVEAELAERRRLQRNIASFGEERAFRMFDGSETDFDRIVRTLTEQPEAKETVRLLDSLDQRIKRLTGD